MLAATRSLDSFVESWRPSRIAHNDFYDDQMLVLPDGGIAMVDFEETGPGDPMLDVGNFLAHLRWGYQIGRGRGAEARRGVPRYIPARGAGTLRMGRARIGPARGGLPVQDRHERDSSSSAGLALQAEYRIVCGERNNGVKGGGTRLTGGELGIIF